MATALVGIGSNLGDPTATVRRALEALAALPGVAAIRGSRLHRARPVGGPGGQREFVNAAARLETSLSPEAVLEGLRGIEQHFGRTRSERWSARTLDLDLLLFDEVLRQEPSLTLPHPRMSFRRFVLEPAAEVAAEMRHPVVGYTVGELLHHLDTAPHYVAIGGLSRTAQLLASSLARAAGAPLLLDTPRRSASSGNPTAEHSAVPPLAEVLEFVERASGLLHRGYWSARPELRPRLNSRPGGSTYDYATPPAVSDFWIEQSRLGTCLHGLGENAGHAPGRGSHPSLEAIEEHRTGIVSPKLVIWLDVRPSLTPEMEQRLPMCLDDLFRRAPCHGLLRLDGTDPDALLAESLAAIEAMEPLKGALS